MLRRLRLFLILALSAVNLYALTVTEEEGAQDKADSSTPQEKAVSEQGRPAVPVKDYSPTEKIKADSAVSFPVDI